MPDGAGQRKRDESMKKLNIGAALDIKHAWDGRHLDEPPCLPELPYHPLVNAYTMGYNAIDHVSLKRMAHTTYPMRQSTNLHLPQTKRYLDNLGM